jgi:hypothetical protein
MRRNKIVGRVGSTGWRLQIFGANNVKHREKKSSGTPGDGVSAEKK